MNYNDEHTDLFDRYLRGECTPEEVAAFEKLLADDQELAAAFEVHKILLSGIQDHGRQELKDFLKQHTPSEGTLRSSWTGKIWYAAAAAVILCVGAYAVLQFYGPEKLSPSKIAVLEEPAQLAAPDSSTDIVLNAPEPLASREMAPPRTEAEAQMNELAITDAPPMYEEMKAKQSENAEFEMNAMKDDAGVNVLTEKKLADTLLTLPVLIAVLDEKDSDNNETSSNGYSKTRSKKMTLPSNANNNQVDYDLKKGRKDNNDTSEQVIPAKPDVSSKQKHKTATRTLKVEFWQSPVNFKGYRFYGDLVQLYGLPENNTRLYVLNNIIYVKSGNMIYVLSDCRDACPYRIETDHETINFIIRQE